MSALAELQQLDWTAIGQETIGHLQALIRLDTTNPPGNEAQAAEYLAEQLSQVGIEPQILAPEPGRASLVARLRGDGSRGPLLLMGHTDVVAAEPDHWSHPPFEAVIADGYLYGRGAVDMKHKLAVDLQIMRLLAELRLPLRRDVIFMAAADEERGGRLGAGWLVEHHAEEIRAEMAINEGGGGAIRLGRHTYYPIQTAEKGTARFTLRARGRPGHASEPHGDNAVVKLARAVAALGEVGNGARVEIVPTARRFLEAVAEDQPEALAEALRRLAGGEEVDLAGAGLDEETVRMLWAMTRNTATPTLLRAGQTINVIPSRAEAGVDGRILPGQTREGFHEQLRRIVPEELEIEFGPGSPPLEGPVDTTFYQALARAIRRHDPEGRPVPFLLNGATDAKHLQRLGTLIYGFMPLRYEPGVMSLAHAHDERISLENVRFAQRVLFDVVTELSAG